MAIKNKIIVPGPTITDILSGTSNTRPANVGIYLCNFSNLSDRITLYVRETGEAAKDKNTIISNLLMLSGDTFHFPYEKFILGSGDAISASGKIGNRVTATVSFLNI